jgi:hypothetical protein
MDMSGVMPEPAPMSTSERAAFGLGLKVKLPRGSITSISCPTATVSSK